MRKIWQKFLAGANTVSAVMVHFLAAVGVLLTLAVFNMDEAIAIAWTMKNFWQSIVETVKTILAVAAIVYTIFITAAVMYWAKKRWS